MDLTYPDFLNNLKNTISGVRWDRYGLVGANPLMAFSTSPWKPDNPFMYITTSSANGDQRLGPLTFLKFGQQVVDFAKVMNVNIRAYPCVNPSAWNGARKLEKRPNAFLEYLVDPGEWKKGTRWDSQIQDFRIRPDLSDETRLLAVDLAMKSVPVASLDMHQDIEMGNRPLVYTYVFGPNKTMLLPLMKRCEDFAFVGRRIPVNDFAGGTVKTDEHGFATAPADGSVQDYFFRRGAQFSVTVETSPALPPPAVYGVNLTWLMGLVRICAKKKEGGRDIRPPTP